MSLTGFAAFDLGPRPYLEDRAAYEKVTTQSGLKLNVAIVCDGVGGQDKGETAAQQAIDAALRTLTQSNQSAVPTLLEEAVYRANQAVLRYGNGGKTTLTMAVVHLDGSPQGRLYVANVGDSRVYIVRTNKETEKSELHQLTMDHTVADDYIRAGYSEAAARQLPDGHHITRALGVAQSINIDLGIYTHTTDETTARNQGLQGLELQSGDTIFACSDGFTKLDRFGKPYVREEEYLRHAMEKNVDRVGKIWMSYASGRTDDNFSLALMFVPSPKRRDRLIVRGSRASYALLAGAAALAVIFFVAFLASYQAFRESEANRSTVFERPSNLDFGQLQVQDIEGSADYTTFGQPNPQPLLQDMRVTAPTVTTSTGRVRLSTSYADVHISRASEVSAEERSALQVSLTSGRVYVCTNEAGRRIQLDVPGSNVLVDFTQDITTDTACLGIAAEYDNQNTTITCFEDCTVRQGRNTYPPGKGVYRIVPSLEQIDFTSEIDESTITTWNDDCGNCLASLLAPQAGSQTSLISAADSLPEATTDMYLSGFSDMAEDATPITCNLNHTCERNLGESAATCPDCRATPTPIRIPPTSAPIVQMQSEPPANNPPSNSSPPSNDTPTDEQPADEQPGDEQPADEQPGDEQPADEQPADEQPADEQPGDEQPADEQPADEQPADEQPAEEPPAEEPPVENNDPPGNANGHDK